MNPQESAPKKSSKSKLKKIIDFAAKKIIKENYSTFKSKLRKVMTGDEKKRVRDHMLELQETTENFKLFDKVSFTIGVCHLMLSQFFFLNLPGYFWVYTSFVLFTSMLTRYYHFKSMDFEYFMLDFCYFSNFCNLICVLFFPNSAWFFKTCFILANGPLPWAIVVWRNSIVFHDFDKVTSVYIHILPSMLTYIGLTHGHCSLFDLVPIRPDRTCEEVYCSQVMITVSRSLTFLDFIFAVLFYLAWQVAYYYKTEVLDKEYLDQHPEKSTSLRWLSADTKNPLARFILRQLRKVGVFGSTEEYDSKTVKTKITFLGSQLVYTIFTYIPCYFMYRWPLVHFSFIVFVVIFAVYNGASFYVEVFSARYQRQLEEVTVPYKTKKKISKVSSKQALSSLATSAGIAVDSSAVASTSTPAITTEALASIAVVDVDVEHLDEDIKSPIVISGQDVEGLDIE